MKKYPFIHLQKLFFANAMLLFSFSALAQKDSTSGQFSLGMRSTISTFTDAGSAGLGSGGEFRIRVTKHMNTEWFADYINTNIQNLGFRRDGHIGWSVVFYLDKNPLMVGKVTPYILAGQCFDYTKVYSDYTNTSMNRWSAAAAQGGFGITYCITSRFDFSVLSQYMMHIGTNIITQVETNNLEQNYLSVTKESGASLDGHLLITFSVNYRLGKL
ncbi:MAG: hypothetical protein ABI199_06630 [Bacteroidia bacterium]